MTDVNFNKGGNIIDFGYALNALREGLKVSRSGWNGKGMWIRIKPALEKHQVMEYPTMTVPFIFMKTVDNEFVPWLASQTDILADDWGVLQ